MLAIQRIFHPGFTHASFTPRSAMPTRRHFPSAGDFPSEMKAKYAFRIFWCDLAVAHVGAR